jgi:hypothetical protein
MTVKDSETLAEILMMGVVVLTAFVIGLVSGIKYEESVFKLEAIQAGAAHYVIDDNLSGNAEFRFINGKDSLESFIKGQ